MSPELKDWFQVGAWAIAIAGGLVAAGKAITEMRRTNEQRREDLRWKQAEMAKACLDELTANPGASAALRMLDWSGDSYLRPGGSRSGGITHEIRRKALRTTDTVFPPGDDDGPFVRDAYDALFDGLARLEHLIRIGLIRFEDVKEPLRYYVAKMSLQDERAVIGEYVRAYEFQLAGSFLERFAEWNPTLGRSDAGGSGAAPAQRVPQLTSRPAPR